MSQPSGTPPRGSRAGNLPPAPPPSSPGRAPGLPQRPAKPAPPADDTVPTRPAAQPQAAPYPTPQPQAFQVPAPAAPPRTLPTTQPSAQAQAQTQAPTPSQTQHPAHAQAPTGAGADVAARAAAFAAQAAAAEAVADTYTTPPDAPMRAAPTPAWATETATTSPGPHAAAPPPTVPPRDPFGFDLPPDDTVVPDGGDDPAPGKRGILGGLFRPPAGKRGKAAEPAKTSVRSSAAFGGSRALVITVRFAVLAFLAFFFAVGFITFAMPRSQPTAQQLAQSVGEILGRNGFPVEAGQTLAVQFADAYLSINPDDDQGRVERLASYTAGVPEDDLRDFQQVPQKVLRGPYLTVAPDLVDESNAVYTVNALVQSGSGAPRWLYLRIPVYADATGAVAVTGMPVFVPVPPRAADVPENDPPEISENLSRRLEEDLFANYFVDWAASNESRLAPWLAADATDAARLGLQGTVRLDTLGSVRVATPPSTGEQRTTAYVTVTWVTPEGVTFEQRYDVTVALNSEDQWQVEDIA